VDEEKPEAPEAPQIPIPPSAGKVTPKPAAVPVVPPPEPPPAPVPPAPPEDLTALKAELEALREMVAKTAGSLEAQAESARKERVREWVKSYGGGLASVAYEALLPKADPSTPEGVQALEGFLRDHHHILLSAPRPPMTPPSDTDRQIRSIFGRRIQTGAEVLG
jgi:hypothetical protein